MLLTDIGVFQAPSAPEVLVSLAHLALLLLGRHLLRIVLHAGTHSVRLHGGTLPAFHAGSSTIVDVNDDVVVNGSTLNV